MASRGQAQSQKLSVEMVGARFKEARARAGLSVAAAAQRAGIKPDRLRRIEAGKIAPMLSEMMALGSAVGLSFPDLILSQDANEFVTLLARAPAHVQRGIWKVLEGIAEVYNLPRPVPRGSSSAGTE